VSEEGTGIDIWRVIYWGKCKGFLNVVLMTKSRRESVPIIYVPPSPSLQHEDAYV